MNKRTTVKLPLNSTRISIIRDIVGLLRYCGVPDLRVLRQFVSAYTGQGVWQDG